MLLLIFFLRTTSCTTLAVTCALTADQQALNMPGYARVTAGLRRYGNSPKQTTWIKQCLPQTSLRHAAGLRGVTVPQA